MSSGGIIILPAAVVLAAGAVVVLTVGAAAVLAVRAAAAAAEGAVRVVGEHGRKLELEAERQEEAELRALRWQAAVGDVIELNARIRMAMRRAKKAGVSVAIPAPLGLAGRTEPEVREWAARAEALLREANQAMQSAVADSEWAELLAEMPAAAKDDAGTVAALDRYRAVLSARYATQTRPPNVSGTEIEEILSGLDPDANEGERVAVLRDAAAIPRDDPREAPEYLSQLLATVATTNGVVARRRRAAQWIGALEDPALANIDPPDPFVGTADKLRRIVDGDADLDDETCREASAAVNWASDLARQIFLRDLVRDCFVDESYTVVEEITGSNSAGLRIGHDDWYGQNSADVWVDEDGTVHAKLLNDVVEGGDEAKMRSRARCHSLNTTLQVIGDRIGAPVEIDEGHVPQHRTGESTERGSVRGPKYKQKGN